MIKILHCGTFGSTYALVRAQRELGHQVDLVEYVKTPLNLPYDFSLGLKTSKPSLQRGVSFYIRNLINGNFKKMIMDYDIYHIHHCAFILPRFFGIDIQMIRLLNKLKLSNKKIVLHYHGHDIFQYQHHKSIWAKGIKKIVSTPNLLKYDEKKEFEYIPNGIDLKEIEYFKKENQGKIKKRKSIPTIVHATVHMGKNRMWKGTDKIVDTVNELKKEGYDFEFILKERVPQKECWLAYMRADIAIDGICYDLGWYGVFSLENAAFGNAILCYLDPNLEKQFLDKSPIINVDFDNLKHKLRILLDDKTLLMGEKKQSLSWVKNYDVKNIAKRWDKLYDDC